MATRKVWRRWFDYWVEKRLPRVQVATLNRKSIFTFPSNTGLMFTGVLVLLWTVATNYQNNLVFAFTALLASMMIVSILHGYGNLSGLRLQVLDVENGFPGDMLRVRVTLSRAGDRPREDILISFPGQERQRVSLKKGQQEIGVNLFLPASARGRRRIDRIVIETTYPVGLIRVWSYVHLEGFGLVYPRPLEGLAVASGGTGESDSKASETQGSEDFAGLRAHQSGESLSRIAWKQLARGQALLSKQFVDPVADPQWLEWEQFPGLDREARLSRLCFLVLATARRGHAYGLRLPGVESNLGVGDSHRDRLLEMLALFELRDDQ